MLLAKSLGATPARSRADLLVSGSVAEGSTSLAKRSFGGLSRVFAKVSSRSSAEARDVSGGEASSVQRPGLIGCANGCQQNVRRGDAPTHRDRTMCM